MSWVGLEFKVITFRKRISRVGKETSSLAWNHDMIEDDVLMWKGLSENSRDTQATPFLLIHHNYQCLHQGNRSAFLHFPNESYFEGRHNNLAMIAFSL